MCVHSSLVATIILSSAGHWMLENSKLRRSHYRFVVVQVDFCPSASGAPKNQFFRDRSPYTLQLVTLDMLLTKNNVTKLDARYYTHLHGDHDNTRELRSRGSCICKWTSGRSFISRTCTCCTNTDIWVTGNGCDHRPRTVPPLTRRGFCLEGPSGI